MNSNDIAYMARVNAGHWLIRKAGKIVSRLAVTAEHRQAIETEIVAIGRRLYEEARHQPRPEATHDPGEDHELEAYVVAVQELAKDAERWFVANDYNHRFSVQQSAERWQNHVSYSKGRAQQ